jgi:phospholipase/lecithinase/hemolysin
MPPTARFSKPTSLSPQTPTLLNSKTRIRASQARRLLSLCAALFLSFTAVLAHAQNYTSIVVFGDSLSDTGNFADLTQAKYLVRIPGPDANYTDGRFTDGDDTLPMAQKYFGVWIEQFAALLPSKPHITNSLNGGTNYAYGDARNGNGTTTVTFGTSNAYSVNVNNIGQQISDYLATSPGINDKTLFAIWGGANDVLDATSPGDVVKGVIAQLINIQDLIDAGATQFIIPNLPPLGSTPAFNGSPADGAAATAASVLYNQLLSEGLSILRDINRGKHLNFVQLDIFSLFNHIVASPAKYALTNVNATAQGIATIDPDTYLFWDDLHPTTRGHNIVAVTALGAFTDATCGLPCGQE